MTDISKCYGKDCDKKDTCFRYLAKEGYWQAYIAMDDLEKIKNCDLYWPIHSEEELNRFQKECDD